MQRKGLGARKNIHGPYRLCLTDQTISLVKIGAQDNLDSIEISVSLQRLSLSASKDFLQSLFHIQHSLYIPGTNGELN